MDTLLLSDLIRVFGTLGLALLFIISSANHSDYR